jgi:hypothetical protein
MNEGQGQPLAQTLTARFQLGTLGTANTIAHGVRVGRQIADALRTGGVLRRLPNRPIEEIRLSAIATIGSREEAYAGYLYLVAAVRRDVTIRNGQVACGMEDSACEIDVLPYGDVRQRIGMKRYAMTYRLLRRLIQEADPPRLVLLDHTLLLPRDFANSEDPDVQREYGRLAQAVDGFWKETRPRLAPWVPGGMVFLGFPESKRLSEPLRLMAAGVADALIDPITPQTMRVVAEHRATLEEVGTARVFSTVLWPEQRSAAFAYSGLNLDPRIEPQILRNDLDVASFHYRPRLRTPPTQVEVPGGRQWSPEALDSLAHRLAQATLFDLPDAVPLPLWLGRQQLQQLEPKRILKQYQLSTFKAIRSGELDEAWLSGWEPEGA